MPSDTVQIFLWLWLATVAWNVEAPWRYHLGFLRDWWAPVAGLVVYFYSRGLADEFGLAPHYQMPVTVDTWLGGGVLPSEWLQAELCGTPCDPSSDPRWFDVLFTTVYSTHFVVGLTIAMVLWLRNRGEWIKWMRRYIGANAAALVVYIFYPMAPPWMAWQEGYLPHEVLRITTAVGRTPAWAASTSSSPGSATRSLRCRRCTRGSRSWSRSTASSGCARRGGGCSRRTRW